MSDHRSTSSTNSTLRRAGVVSATVGSVLGAGAFVLLGIGGPSAAAAPAAQAATLFAPAGDDDGDPPIDNLGDLLLGDEEPDEPIDLPVGPMVDGPILTIPIVPDDDDDDDDGPIYNVPILTDEPIFEGPIMTIPLPPGDTVPSDPPAETVPVDPPADTPVDSAAPPTAATVPPSEAPEGDAGVAPFLIITSATVDCAGMVHVTYETGAEPDLAESTEHVVMFSPASDPARVTSQRLLDRPTDGVFTLDVQSPIAEAYRVYVVADFEPANVEGVLLVDEADAAAPVDCPAPSSAG